LLCITTAELISVKFAYPFLLFAGGIQAQERFGSAFINAIEASIDGMVLQLHPDG
jgi:hypothetical protein